MRTVAALVRHGAHEQSTGAPDGQKNLPLTSQGEAEARELAQAILALSTLHSLTLHPVIDASPLLAAYQTACIAAEALTSATRRPFRVDQHAVLSTHGRAASTDLDLLEQREAGERVARHLHASICGLASKSRASKLKLFVGHGREFRYACAELGVLEAARVLEVSMNRCQPVLLEWPTQGAWRHLDGSWTERSAASDVG